MHTPVPERCCLGVEGHSKNQPSNVLLPVRIHIIAAQLHHKVGEGECDEIGVIGIDPVHN